MTRRQREQFGFSASKRFYCVQSRRFDSAGYWAFLLGGLVEFDDHDPWNEQSHRHPCADELMRDPMFWDCVNELAPFGSDEGADAYVEYRSWRSENPDANLVDCISWILGGKQAAYNDSLIEDVAIQDSDKSAREFGYADAFTLDATIIATVLGQLVDEGRIDVEAKPFAATVILRQSHPSYLARLNESAIAERKAILHSVQQVIYAA